MDSNEIYTFLESKFSIRKKSNVEFRVLVEDASTSNRIETMNTVRQLLKKEGVEHKLEKSSIGYLLVNNTRIFVKPAALQGHGSTGIRNELELVNKINKTIKNHGISNVVFFTSNTEFNINYCIEAKRSGADTFGRKKADVDISVANGMIFKISLKKDNSDYWESADSYYGKKANRLLKKAVKKGIVKLEPKPNFFKNGKPVYQIDPNVFIESTMEEKQAVIFGSDIKPDSGAVIKKTLIPESFKYDAGHLKINCSNIIRRVEDVLGTNNDVIFGITNSKDRNSKTLGFQGIRVRAFTKDRITLKMIEIK